MAYPFNTYPQYFPQGYQQYNQMPQQVNQQTPQIQNGGFVPVPNIEVARNYHVAPGTSVTFIDENAPYVYTKTRGFSQLEQPVFEKLRLVREEDVPQKPREAQKEQDPMSNIDYVTKAEFGAIVDAQGQLRKELDELKASLGEETNE